MDAMTESVIHQTLFTNFMATTIIAIMHKLESTISVLNTFSCQATRVGTNRYPVLPRQGFGP